MLDFARFEFVVANNRWRNRQTGCIGRSPTSRAKLVRREVEDRRLIGKPFAILFVHPEKLVQFFIRRIDDNRVPVGWFVIAKFLNVGERLLDSFAFEQNRITFDRQSVRNRIRTFVDSSAISPIVTSIFF